MDNMVTKRRVRSNMAGLLRRSAVKIFTAVLLVLAGLLPGGAAAGHYPMYASWPQPGGPGTPFTLTYSYSNLFDGGVLDTRGAALSDVLMRSAFEQAFADYAAVLPIHFVEIVDSGPPPESGEYDPSGLADIRIGVVPHVHGANAYAYFPFSTASGLAGDVIFNGERFGYGWSAVLFYAVAQHELGHSLGMGHYLDGEARGQLPLFSDSAYDGPLFPLDEMMITALQGVYGAGSGSVTALSPVPEPQSALMMLAGLAVLGRRRWKDKPSSGALT